MMRIFRKGERYVLSRPKVLFDFHKSGLVTLLICLFSFHFVCFAQESRLGGTTGIGEIKPLQIGDTIPEELWHMPLQVVNHPDGKDTITLNDYRDKKLIILDFWATWCGGCISAISKNAQFQNKSNLHLYQILPVSYETKEHVKEFCNINALLKDINQISIVEDEIFEQYFPFNLIPHYVWINNDGEVRYITNSNEVNLENINKTIYGQTLDLKLKKDHLNWNERFPILFNHSHSLSFFWSIFRERDEGYPSRQNLIYKQEEDRLKIVALNQSIKSLYERAYRFPAMYHSSKIVVNNITPDKLEDLLYCYEAEILGNDTLRLFSLMQSELDLLLNISSQIKNEEKWCWVIKIYDKHALPKSSKSDPFYNLMEKNRSETIIRGHYIYLLTSVLSKIYDDLPMLNESEIKYLIDVELPADLSDLDSLNDRLTKYGLILKKEKRQVRTLYLSKN